MVEFVLAYKHGTDPRHHENMLTHLPPTLDEMLSDEDDVPLLTAFNIMFREEWLKLQDFVAEQHNQLCQHQFEGGAITAMQEARQAQMAASQQQAPVQMNNTNAVNATSSRKRTQSESDQNTQPKPKKLKVANTNSGKRESKIQQRADNFEVSGDGSRKFVKQRNNLNFANIQMEDVAQIGIKLLRDNWLREDVFMFELATTNNDE